MKIKLKNQNTKIKLGRGKAMQAKTNILESEMSYVTENT